MSVPKFEDIEVAVDGARGELHLNRPKKLNAIGPRMLREVGEAAAWFDAQPDLKVVVVSGRGRAFSAGADVSAFARPASGPPAPVPREGADAGRRMADALERMAAVTIVKLHGHCVGGGLVLAGACDIRIAAEDATFLIPEVDLGIPLAWGGIWADRISRLSAADAVARSAHPLRFDWHRPGRCGRSQPGSSVGSSGRRFTRERSLVRNQPRPWSA